MLAKLKSILATADASEKTSANIMAKVMQCWRGVIQKTSTHYVVLIWSASDYYQSCVLMCDQSSPFGGVLCPNTGTENCANFC